MKVDLTDTEVRLIKKLLNKDLDQTRTVIKLTKIFDLLNKLTKRNES